jgi:hypothetical protein
LFVALYCTSALGRILVIFYHKRPLLSRKPPISELYKHPAV